MVVGWDLVFFLFIKYGFGIVEVGGVLLLVGRDLFNSGNVLIGFFRICICSIC